MNYLLVGIFSVLTAVPISRVVFAAAADFAASSADTIAAASPATAAPAAALAAAAMLLPRLPYFIFLVFISRLFTISRGSSGRRG